MTQSNENKILLIGIINFLASIMDEIDLIILKKLMENSRVTYRELANITNMSVSAMHNRIKNLLDDGIISTFTARPSPIALKYLIVTLFGRSNIKSLDAVSEELGQHENVFVITIASGKVLYITGLLRDITSLRDFSGYVSKIAKMSEPTIGIMNLPYLTTPESLNSIDYKILKTLNRDSRKPIIDIADDIGLSAKTVRKRLDRMIDNNLVTFGINWAIKAENNLLTAFHVNLKEDTNINSTMQYLYEKYSQNIIFCIGYSNIPNFIMLIIWTKTAQESQIIQEKLQTEGFKDIIPHIYFTLKYYDCWVDQLLRTK
ncbi:MAG TPA: winged helix-turn-helix transcriptional regulator [bacterium]|nr:winged helix-turn-helix transcriptional regulator [bacterium]